MSRWGSFDWNDAAIEQLLALWNEGKSASQVGMALGVTRNAVIGKLHRLGLSGMPRRTFPSRARKLALPARRASPKRSQIPQMRSNKRPPGPPQPFTLTLLELGPRHCKWPAPGDEHPFTFCGQLREIGPYCEPHYKLAHYKGSQRDVDLQAARAMGKVFHFGRAGVEA